MAELTRLFEPIKIGSLELPNRIAMEGVTTTYDAIGYGYPNDDRFIRFYTERIRGGTGMVILGAIQALYPGRGGVSGAMPDASEGTLKVNDDVYLPRLANVVNEVHKAGGKIGILTGVYGYWAKRGVGTPAEEVSPSGIIVQGDPFRPGLEGFSFIKGGRPLEVDEIHAISEQVADAAVRSVKAGFDLIELQALGGNLLARFLSPYTNRRTDEYGGSLRNRARFILETIAAIKRKIGEHPLSVRINGDDLMPSYLDPPFMNLKDYVEFAPMLEEAGVHLISVMPGWYETRRPVNQACVKQGSFVYAAEAIKKVVKTPVMTNIRIVDPSLAEAIVADGKADMVALVAALMADPEWGNKAKEGRLEDVRRCVACVECWSDLAEHTQPIACSVNPRAGKEIMTEVSPSAKSKRVMIVGGGPGGMQAAITAASRGHEVTLWEKSDRLGGQMNYAVLPPHKDEWRPFLAWLQREVRKAGVAVKLGAEVTVAAVEASKPDAIVIATGAMPIVPRIPGVNGSNVVAAIDVLQGKVSTGKNVIVIGGGSVGCETAEFIVSQGKKVTVLEMLPVIAQDVRIWNRWVLLDRLESLGIRTEVNAKAAEITADGVRVERDGKAEFFAADTVVIAVGMKSENALVGALQGKAAEVIAIGDAVKPSKVRDAVEQGFRVGCEL